MNHDEAAWCDGGCCAGTCLAGRRTGAPRDPESAVVTQQVVFGSRFDFDGRRDSDFRWARWQFQFQSPSQDAGDGEINSSSSSDWLHGGPQVDFDLVDSGCVGIRRFQGQQQVASIVVPCQRIPLAVNAAGVRAQIDTINGHGHAYTGVSTGDHGFERRLQPHRTILLNRPVVGGLPQ